MADDVIETLAKLKPATPDRDAILFAAGRASARHSPAWIWTSIGLMVSQAVLLGLWIQPANSQRPVEKVPAEAPMTAPTPAIPETPSLPFDRSATLWNLDPPTPEPVPSASVVPEAHWTARTNLSDLRID